MTSEGLVLIPESTSGAPDGCDVCADRIARRVLAIPGIASAEVERQPLRILYRYDAAQVAPTEIERVVQAEHVAGEQRFLHHVLAIEGMDCDGCAQTLERGVNRLAGVEHAEVNFGAARMAVEYDRQITGLDAIGQRVRELGYEVGSPEQAHVGERQALVHLLRKRDNALALAAGVFTLVGLIAMMAGADDRLSIASYAAAVLVGGLPLLRKGVRTLATTRSLDINLLMSLAVIGAAAIGDWLEAATVVFLFSLGEALEGYAMDRVRRSVRSLLSLAPATALVKEHDVEVERPVSEIQVGQQVVVRAGQRVPLDGVVVAGFSSVDQSSLTGESLPVGKEIGDPVFAGTMNGSGPLTMRVTQLAADSSVAKIIRLVEHAQGQRAPVQRIVDRFARVYTPAVIAGAAVVAVVPPLFTGEWLEWLSRALVLLVISCPCALVLSTPISIVSALSAAARHGILIKGGAVLERAGSIDAVAFDKTGTLTHGKPEVVSVTSFDGRSNDDVLVLAATLERHSEHPLGRAIVVAGFGTGPSGLREVSNEQVVPGRGLTAAIDGVPYRIGSSRLFDAPLTIEATDAVREIESRGGTTVLVGERDLVVGVIGLADGARADAGLAVEELRAAGVSQIVMLSGDRPAAAQRVALDVGISDVRAELLPEDKLATIDALRRKGHVVAMVGDGVNDAPSLAAADVGIAMGVAGTDSAVETADIALMGDDLRGLAETIRLGERTSRIVRMNIGISIVTKLLFLALAVFGHATLWMAIVADVGVSLLVIANGLRLLRWPERSSANTPTPVLACACSDCSTPASLATSR